MIPFAAYTTAETPNAFQWDGQPPKLPLPVEDLNPINDSLNLCKSAPQTTSRSVEPFLQGSQTNRHTDRPRYSVLTCTCRLKIMAKR